MEKINFVKNGTVLRLPPGFRFHPTDEELVLQYLKRKVLSYPLPASIIQEVDVNKSDPWDLPGDSEQEKYFFSTREVKYPNGKRSNRATGSGYWKATGIDKQIRHHDQVVGMKKTLVFYTGTGRPPTGCRTHWIMHEYRLAEAQGRSLGQENWVVCRIFLKRRSNKVKHKNDEQVAQVQKGSREEGKSIAVFYDFMGKDRTDWNRNLVTVSSSSDSSGITEIESDDREESSSFTRKTCQQNAIKF